MRNPDNKRAKWSRYVNLFCVAVATQAFSLEVAGAEYFIHGYGKKQPFCEAVLKALNASQPKEGNMPCVSEVVRKLPGVQDPKWEKLDLLQHEDLVMQMETLWKVGTAEFFRVKKLDPRYPTSDQQRNGFAYVKKKDAELLALRLAPVLYGDRVLVTLRWQDQCGEPSERNGENDYAAWVSSDLEQIARGPGLFDARAGRPLLYRGKLYLMRTYGSAEGMEFYVPAVMHEELICDIRFSYQ